MTQKELDRIKEFKGKHSKHYYNGSLRFKITLRSTGIGEVVKIKCSGCNKKKDITDLDSW